MAKCTKSYKISESMSYSTEPAAKGTFEIADKAVKTLPAILKELNTKNTHFSREFVNKVIFNFIRQFKRIAEIDTKYGDSLIDAADNLKIAYNILTNPNTTRPKTSEAIKYINAANASLVDIVLNSRSDEPENTSKYAPANDNNISTQDEIAAYNRAANFFDDDEEQLSEMVINIFNEGTSKSKLPEMKAPCPKTTENKRTKAYFDFKKAKMINFEEDEESAEDITEQILAQFDSIYAMANGLSTADILQKMQKNRSIFEKNKIMFGIQNLINSHQLRVDPATKKLFVNNDEAEESEFTDIEEMTDKSIDDAILDYFDSSVTAGIGGISINEVVKDIKKETGSSKPEIMSCITKLLKDKKLQKGVTPGTIMLNSTDEEEESLIPNTPGIGSSTNQNSEQPLTNQETPESLKLKGWKEETPGQFISPDGSVKYILSKEEKTINMCMGYKDVNYEQLCEEFDRELDEIENSDIDNTEGLDEFDSETEDMDMEDDTDFEDDSEMITVELTKDEADILRKILAKVDGTDIEADDEVDEVDDDFVDDAATDEEANAELMGDADLEEDEDEEWEDSEDIDWGSDEDEDWMFDEDEESLADDSTSGVYDGSFSDGAPVLKKHTATADRKNKPITGKGYTPSAHGSAFDGAGRKGQPTMSKATPAFDKSGKPVKSKTTSGVGKSIFAL